MKGTVQIDEAYFGGKAKTKRDAVFNMNDKARSQIQVNLLTKC